MRDANTIFIDNDNIIRIMMVVNNNNNDTNTGLTEYLWRINVADNPNNT